MLRAIVPRDVPSLFEIFGNDEVCRYWSREALSDISEAAGLQAHIEQHFRNRTLFQWGVAARASDALIGTCTLGGLSYDHRRAELGFALSRSAWGSGYMREALPALLRFAFDELRFHRLEADVDPRNARSIRALERLGFTREGHLRERYFLHGEVQDALLYGLLQPEWASRERTRA